MQGKPKKIVDKIIRVVRSRYFFWAIIILFVLQAAWVALSFRYPMIYDEYYHFGLIEYFSHQWLPWINNQPVSLDQYGALARNPYLLYHYLMSFPFRAVALLVSDLNLQIIVMRFINIGIFAAGIIMYERLFKFMKIQPIFRNIALLFFVLIPATPFVAATINYDSAIFLLSSVFLLLGVKIIRSDIVNWQQLAGILLVGMVGSLMKIAFLPIFVSGLVFLFGWAVYKKKIKIQHLYKSFLASILWWRVGIVLPLILVGSFFVERFGINIVQYQAIQPACESQLSVLRCNGSSINRRSYRLAIQKSDKTPEQAPIYTSKWGSTMLYSLMFTAANASGNLGTRTAQPLPIAYIIVFMMSVVSFAALFYGLERLRRLPGFLFVITISAVYIIILFYVNLSTYYEYYEPIAIQGRYLLPLLPGVMAFSLLGLNYALRGVRQLKLPILIIILLLYLNGAGIVTHIMRSNCSWYWDNQTVCEVNNKSRGVLTPFIKEDWYDK